MQFSRKGKRVLHELDESLKSRSQTFRASCAHRAINQIARAYRAPPTKVVSMSRAEKAGNKARVQCDFATVLCAYSRSIFL